MQSAHTETLRRWSSGHAAVLLIALVIAVGTGSLTILLVGAVSLLALVVTTRPRHPRVYGLGVANAITSTRLVLGAIGVVTAPRSLVAFGCIGLLIFALDGVDGWLARRYGEVDELGSVLDMETDAYVALLLSAAIVIVGGVGAWALLAGALRYLFVVARWLVDPPVEPERRSRAGRLFFFVLMTALLVACLPVARWVAKASAALAVAVLIVSFATDFRLLARVAWRPRAVLAMGIALDVLLFVPWAFLRAGAYFAESPETHLPDGFDAVSLLHVSTEWVVVMLLVVLAARTRLAGLVRWVGGVAYAVFLLFLVYHQGYLYSFHRPPAIVSDVLLLVRFFHFLQMEPKWVPALVAVLGGLVLLGVAAVDLLKRAQDLARGPRGHRLLVALVVATGACLGSLVWSGIEHDRPIVQLLARHVLLNVEFSKARLRAQRVFAAAQPDLTYEPLLRPMFARTPNVHLMMVEAYGEVLASSEMREAYQGALARLDARLARRGYSFATSYSRSPVHGGVSWFAISTVQTGILIDAQNVYDALEVSAARVPSLTSFLRAQGYHTMTLQPGNSSRAGLHHFDLFGRETVVEAPELRYVGHRYGWGGIPDQYSFGFFREHYLKTPPSPRFVFFMSVSTHLDWSDVPPYVDDWRSLNAAKVPAPAPSAPLPGMERIADEGRRHYITSVDYDLRVLGDYIEGEGETDGLFIILGDHQPYLGGPRGSYDTPLHVLSRDGALVERFRARGFATGLFAEPGTTPPLAHEGLFSLFASILAEHNGAAEPITVHPKGIPQAGLKR